MDGLPKRESLTALQHENREAAERESAVIKQDIERRAIRILARMEEEKRNEKEKQRGKEDKESRGDDGIVL